MSHAFMGLIQAALVGVLAGAAVAATVAVLTFAAYFVLFRQEK